MRAFGLDEKFEESVKQAARDAAHSFDPDNIDDDRTDLTDLFIATIDPPDARDFDDAISLIELDPSTEKDGAAFELGVHIADVSHFVKPGTALDDEAAARGNSTYLPRKVIPMMIAVVSRLFIVLGVDCLLILRIRRVSNKVDFAPSSVCVRSMAARRVSGTRASRRR